jgi:hypothetical protein
MRAIEWVLFLLVVGLSITTPLADPDLWWHLTIGRWILGHDALPTVELWNRFGFGHQFVPYSWSFEIVVAGLERLGGLRVVLVGQLVLVGILAIVIGWCISQAAKDFFFGAIIGAMVTSGFVAQYTLRPQSIVWLLFALLLVVCFQIRNEGISRGRLLSLALITGCWANLHITTILAIGTIVVSLFSIKEPKRLILPLSVALFATCCTPHFGYEWIVFFSKADHPVALRSIAEFGAGTILDYPVGILGILMSLLLGFLHISPRAVPAPLLGLVGVFTLGGLAVVKFLPFALVSTGYALGVAWHTLRKDILSGAAANLVDGFERLRRVVRHSSGGGLSFLLLSLAVIKVHSLMVGDTLVQANVPQGAVDFIIENKLPRPFMNTFGDGGYVMYRLSNESGELSAEDRVNIDGRTNINDAEIMVLNQKALSGHVHWQRYLEKVGPNTILWRNQSPLTSILLATGEWCRVYAEGSSESGHSVFLRRVQAGTGDLPQCLITRSNS